MTVNTRNAKVLIDQEIFEKIKSIGAKISTTNTPFNKAVYILYKDKTRETLAKYILGLYDRHRQKKVHKNGNEFDYRLENLEVISKYGRKRKKYSGVKNYFYKTLGRSYYSACIYYDSHRVVRIGYIEEEKEAALIVDAMYKYIDIAYDYNIKEEKIELKKKYKKMIDKEIEENPDFKRFIEKARSLQDV